MSESILMDVRVACDLEAIDSSFDEKLIQLINGKFMDAHEFGVGYDGFTIMDTSATWSDWLGAGEKYLAGAKTWLGYSVKLMFDPPTNATELQVLESQIKKFEVRLRDKSCTDGYVKEYVPSKADFYDSLLDDD